MPPTPDRTATTEEAAASVVAPARACGSAAAAEIEDRAALLLGAFARAHPEHPVARYVDRVEDDEIEAFFDAIARAACAGGATPSTSSSSCASTEGPACRARPDGRAHR